MLHLSHHRLIQSAISAGADAGLRRQDLITYLATTNDDGARRGRGLHIIEPRLAPCADMSRR